MPTKSTQKKSRGRPTLQPGEKGRYQYSRVQKKKVGERRKIAAQKKNIENAEKRLEKLDNQSKALKKSDQIAGKGGVLDDRLIDTLPAQVRQQLHEDTELIFKPNEGPQTDFLASPEKEVLYGAQQVVESPMLCLLTFYAMQTTQTIRRFF